MMVNRYEIRTVDAAGNEGAAVAVAQQRRMAFNEAGRAAGVRHSPIVLLQGFRAQRAESNGTQHRNDVHSHLASIRDSVFHRTVDGRTFSNQCSSH